MNTAERDRLTIMLLSDIEQEQEQALDAVSETDETLDEFLDIAEGHKAYYDSQAVQPEAVVAEQPRRSRRWLYYSAAAVLIGIVGTLFFLLPRHEDSVVVAENELTEQRAAGAAETAEAQPSTHDADNEAVSSAQSEGDALAPSVRYDAHAAAAAPSAAAVAMLYPESANQRADGDMLPLVLRWHGDKATAKVSIFDMRGVLIESYTTRSSHLNLDYDLFAPYGRIRWVVDLVTDGGEELRYEGYFDIDEQE